VAFTAKVFDFDEFKYGGQHEKQGEARSSILLEIGRMHEKESYD
jgi:hypothetical protein